MKIYDLNFPHSIIYNFLQRDYVLHLIYIYDSAINIFITK